MFIFCTFLVKKNIYKKTSKERNLVCLFVLVDLPASRNPAGSLLGYHRQADVLSISTNISLTSMIEIDRLLR